MRKAALVKLAIRRAALVLSFLPGFVAVAGFAVLATELKWRSGVLFCGNYDPFSENLPLLFVGVFILLLASLAWWKPVVGGVLLMVFGSWIFFAQDAGLAPTADPDIYRTVALPCSVALIVSGVLRLVAAPDQDSPG